MFNGPVSLKITPGSAGILKVPQRTFGLQVQDFDRPVTLHVFQPAVCNQERSDWTEGKLNAPLETSSSLNLGQKSAQKSAGNLVKSRMLNTSYMHEMPNTIVLDLFTVFFLVDSFLL